MGSAQWSELFTKHTFFHKYRYYLQVIASTGNADLQIKWYLSRRGDDSFTHIIQQGGHGGISNTATCYEA